MDLKNVLHIPSCQRQLISVGLVTDSGCEVRVENNKMTVDIGGPFLLPNVMATDFMFATLELIVLLLRWFPLLRPSHSGTSA